MIRNEYALIKEIFQAALELPVAEREHFVRKQSNGNPEIEKEVMSLLDNHRDDTILHNPGTPPSFEKEHTHSGEHIAPKYFDNTRSLNATLWLERLFGNKQRFGITLILLLFALIVLGLWAHRQVKNSLEEIRSDEL